MLRTPGEGGEEAAFLRYERERFLTFKNHMKERSVMRAGPA
jgi:hypothetical protein